MVSENTNPIWLFSDCLGISIVKMTDTEKNSFESFDQLETVSQFMACDICLEASVFTGRKFPPHSWRVWGCGDEVSGKHCHVYCMLLDFIPTLQRSIVVGA